jgi:hypothetical protein
METEWQSGGVPQTPMSAMEPASLRSFNLKLSGLPSACLNKHVSFFTNSEPIGNGRAFIVSRFETLFKCLQSYSHGSGPDTIHLEDTCFFT